MSDSVQPRRWQPIELVRRKIHFLLHVTISLKNGSLFHKIRQDYASKQFFWFSVSSEGTDLSNFFTFPICFKYQMTIEWSMLSSLAASHVVIRGSALMMALNWSLSTSNGQPPHSSSSSHLSPLQNFLNYQCTVRSLAFPRPAVSLMLQVVSAALQPILNSNLKISHLLFVWHHFYSLK